jgi:hypothetical protein
MGRARGQSSAVTVGGFNAVLGARRGSAGAQAARDTGERQARERALQQFALDVEAKSGSANTASLLAALYKGAETYQGDAAREQMIEELDWQVTSANLREVATIMAVGDPQLCPGLTAPAVEALGRFYARPAAEQELLAQRAYQSDSSTVPAGVGVTRGQAEAVVVTALLGPRELAHYERLRPLCEGLGAYLARQPSIAGESLCIQAARALRSAPTAALAGPLASWVKAFARRIDEEKLSGMERNILQNIIADQMLDSALAPAFGPIAERLIPAQA